MSGYPQTYAPGEVVVTFGASIITGFGDEIVSAKRNVPLNSMVVGADGESAFVRSADRTGEVKVTLKQTSMSNLTLSSIVQLDELVGGQVRPLMLADNNGNLLWAGEGRLAGYPEEI